MLNLLKLNQEAKKTTPAANRRIEYIVIHYSAGITSRPGSAIFVADYFRDTEIKASADFIVDDAIAVQFNPDLQNRYTWHCGRSKKKENRSGILSQCTNQNSIGIEICSENRKHQITYSGDEAYSFTEAVLKNAAVLVGSLMEAYDIDISHVVRHYDVTGKECPGVRGWFGPADESSEWLKFKDRAIIERDRLIEANGIPENEFSRMRDDEFSEYLIGQGFTSGYIDKLTRLHRSHPNWVFKSCLTGLKWRDVIVRETADKVSLTRIDTYKKDAIIVDAGEWCNAKKGAVEYFIDPRNFLNEDGICMFQNLSYDPDTDCSQIVAKILSPVKLPENGFTADVFINAGRNHRISPVYLASRARQETGGGSDCINGSRYKGRVCCNPLNIGAGTGLDTVRNALEYAYVHGWDTPEKAVNGAAKLLSENYIHAGQNTIYFQKFNVANGLTGVATHQYMTNIKAPSMEAHAIMESYRSMGVDNEILTFIIPVFEDMPETTVLP